MNETTTIVKDKIIKDNKLIEAGISNLTPNAFKLLLYMTTELVMENLEKQADGYKLTFKHADFLNSIGLTSESRYSELKKYLKILRNTTIEIPIIENGEEVGWVITGFIDKAWVYQKGFSTVKFDSDLLPYLYKLRVERETTILRYNLMKQFNSIFSMRIYELLIRWRNTEHKKIRMDLEELKITLGVNGKYKNFKDFERKVLSIAKREIDSMSDITINYQKLCLGERAGKGKPPITHIEFVFKLKNERQEKEILTDDQIKDLLEIAEQRVIGTDKTASEFYDYAFAVTLENCTNDKGFYKYLKNTLKTNNVFLGQLSMFAHPDVRAAAQQKSKNIQDKILSEKREKALTAAAEFEKRELQDIEDRVEQRKAKMNG